MHPELFWRYTVQSRCLQQYISLWSKCKFLYTSSWLGKGTTLFVERFCTWLKAAFWTASLHLSSGYCLSTLWGLPKPDSVLLDLSRPWAKQIKPHRSQMHDGKGCGITVVCHAFICAQAKPLTITNARIMKNVMPCLLRRRQAWWYLGIIEERYGWCGRNCVTERRRRWKTRRKRRDGGGII